MLLLVFSVLVGVPLAVLAGWAGWFVAVDRAVVLRQLWVAAAAEAVLLVQVVVTAVLLVSGHPVADGATWWGYAVTSLVLLPVAAAWAFAERTRWSSVVMVVAVVSLAVVQWRMVDIWGAGA